jgi:hypothetical protein
MLAGVLLPPSRLCNGRVIDGQLLVSDQAPSGMVRTCRPAGDAPLAAALVLVVPPAAPVVRHTYTSDH